MVTKIAGYAPAATLLQIGDVLLEVADRSVACNSIIEFHSVQERIPFDYLCHSKFAGDSVTSIGKNRPSKSDTDTQYPLTTYRPLVPYDLFYRSI